MIRVWCIVALVVGAITAASDQKIFPPALPIGALSDEDRQHFLDVFKGFNKDSVKEAHYALIGNSAFDQETIDGIPCDKLKSAFDSSDIETRYFALSAARGVKSCTHKVSKPTLFTDALKNDKLTVDQLFYLVSSANLAKVNLDKATVFKLLSGFINKETGPSGLSTILATAAIVPDTTATDLEPLSPLVGKLVRQADEVDGTLLFFERGAYITAFAVESIFRFAAALKRAPALTEQQIVKFGNFLYERRHAHQIRTAARVASALKILATNPFVNPVVVYGSTVHEKAGVSGILVSSSRRLQLRLFDLFGTRLNSAMTITAGGLYSFNESSSSTTVIGPASLGDFKLDSSNDVFEMDLGAKAGGLPRGRYELELTVTPTKKTTLIQLAGVSNVKIPLRLLSPLNVERANLKVFDSVKTLVDSPLAYPGSRYSEVLRLHHASRLRLSFALEDGVAATPSTQAPSPPPPQQVFVHLAHSTTQQSITFLTKRSTTDGTYSFTLSVSAVADDFDRVSGVYEMVVLIGDALLENPISWHVADVELRFPASSDDVIQASELEDVARLYAAPASTRKRASVHPRVGEAYNYFPKPELEHTFRAPEPRPSNLVAFAFTALCSAPLFILLLVWPMMGANISNFPCSLSALFFHLGLGGIFALYLFYWYKLDMFTTLRYLLFLGVCTFFSGNRLLRLLVAKRRKGHE